MISAGLHLWRDQDLNADTNALADAVAESDVSCTDTERHDDIYHNGSSGFGGNADSAETADLDAGVPR